MRKSRSITTMVLWITFWLHLFPSQVAHSTITAIQDNLQPFGHCWQEFGHHWQLLRSWRLFSDSAVQFALFRIRDPRSKLNFSHLWPLGHRERVFTEDNKYRSCILCVTCGWTEPVNYRSKECVREMLHLISASELNSNIAAWRTAFRPTAAQAMTYVGVDVVFTIEILF